MKIASASIYAHAVPEGHRFPMLKYELIPEQLLHQGVITQDQFLQPQACAMQDVLRTHDAQYVHRLQNLLLTDKEQRAIGFTQSKQLFQRELTIMQGTIDCALYALTNNSVALNVAGGTHHSFVDRGEGFCLLNDMAIAANYVLHHGLAKRVLIIDLDVHQGNGTAKLFEGRQDVFTFSMHGAHNYPFHKEQSHLDVPLQDGTSDQEYLELLHTHLPQIIHAFQPDFALYLSGVDILNTDKFGKLQVSLAGCMRRDQFVFSQLRKHNIPCAVAMGGGYSADIKIIVEAHCNTFIAASDIF
jgi:acetoin utilization deacetylase AcuC-like enzyme